MKDWIPLATGLAWPILVGLVVWRLLPAIRGVIGSRAFTVKIAGTEISVEQASVNLKNNVEDLREQLSALKAQVEAGGGAASPITDGLPDLRSVLWVDDFPDNNVFEVDALRRKGVRVDQVRSTEEALRAFGARTPPYSAVVTDMSREEGGHDNPRAGLELIAEVRRSDAAVPLIVYASAPAVARTRDEALRLGATVATSSATELLDALGRVGQS
jgi:CheY-like chemotaxis protein